MIIANIVVTAFVALMAYFWYTQGFFSAFLHMVAVIVAGTLAFALWEPTAHWLLANGGVVNRYAWSIGLLGWFVIFLAIIRFGMDYYVRGNVILPNLANLIGGGLCGLVSGVLTAGIMVIGVGFLPLPIDLGGYQPYGLNIAGQIERTEHRLWVPADEITDEFYSRLSSGAFAPLASNVRLATHRPDLVAQSALFRLRLDPNASLVASPGQVSVDRMFEFTLSPDEEMLPERMMAGLGTRAEQGGRKLIAVETTWQRHDAAYDGGTLRIPATQIQLVTRERRGEEVVIHRHNPVAFSKADARTDGRRLYPFDNSRVVAYTGEPSATLTWAFVPPAQEEPQFLLIRQVRYPLAGLERVEDDQESLVASVGMVPEEVVEEAEEGEDRQPAQRTTRRGTATSELAPELQITSRLPMSLSQNHARGFVLEGNSIISGHRTVSRYTGRLSEQTRIDNIYNEPNMRMLRLEVDMDEARSLFGRYVAAAGSIGGITLEDHRGTQWDPIAYVWRKSGGDQEIRVDFDRPIRSARELPQNVQDSEELYLYYSVTPGVTIERYNIGARTSRPVDLQVD